MREIEGKNAKIQMKIGNKNLMDNIFEKIRWEIVHRKWFMSMYPFNLMRCDSKVCFWTHKHRPEI